MIFKWWDLEESATNARSAAASRAFVADGNGKTQPRCASVRRWHRRSGVTAPPKTVPRIACAFRRQRQTEALMSPHTLFGGKFASACDNLTQINPDGPGNAQQRVQRGISQISLNKSDDGMRETGALSDHVHGKSVLFTFFPQQPNDVGGNGIAQVVF